MGVLLYVRKNHFFFAKIRSTPPPPVPTHSALAVLCFFFCLDCFQTNQSYQATADESVWVKRQRMLRNRNRLPRGPFSSFRFQTVKHRRRIPVPIKRVTQNTFVVNHWPPLGLELPDQFHLSNSNICLRNFSNFALGGIL